MYICTTLLLLLATIYYVGVPALVLTRDFHTRDFLGKLLPIVLPRSPKLTFTKSTHKINHLWSCFWNLEWIALAVWGLTSLHTPVRLLAHSLPLPMSCLQRSCLGFPSLHSCESLCRAGSGQIAVLLFSIARQSYEVVVVGCF